MNPQQQEQWDIDFVLREIARRLKLVSAGSAMGGWLSGTVLLLFGFVLWDHWDPGGVPLPAARLLRVAYLIASTLWLILAVVLPLARRVNNLYAARLIERAHPEFRNSLVAALQLADREDLPGSVRSAVLGRAAQDVRCIDPLRSVSTGRLRQACRVTLAAIAVFGGYAVFAPKPVLPSIERALGAKRPAPTRTVIRDIRPADGLRVMRGEPVDFTATLEGRVPTQAVVRFSRDDGRTWVTGQELALTCQVDAQNGVWEGTKSGQDLQQGVHWRLFAGDAMSELRYLDVRIPPEIAGINVRYTYPRYTGLPPTTQPGGDIDALAGTRVQITAEANVPARRPILVTGTGPDEKRRLLTDPTPAQPRRITAELEVVQDDRYQFLFSDELGNVSRDPISYAIRCRPDRSPRVDLEGSTAQADIDASGVLAVGARAEDDFGLTRAAFCWQVLGKAGKGELPIAIETKAGGRVAQVGSEVAIGRMQVGEKDIVEWWVSAWDNRENREGRPDPQRGDSAKARFTVRTGLLVDAASRPAPTSMPHPADRPQEAVASSASAPAADEVAAKNPESASSRPSGLEGGDRRDEAIREFAEKHQKELETIERALGERSAESRPSPEAGLAQTPQQPGTTADDGPSGQAAGHGEDLPQPTSRVADAAPGAAESMSRDDSREVSAENRSRPEAPTAPNAPSSQESPGEPSRAIGGSARSPDGARSDAADGSPGGQQSSQSGVRDSGRPSGQTPSASDQQSGSTSAGQSPDSPSSRPAGAQDSGNSQTSSSGGSTPGQPSNEQGGPSGLSGQPQAGGQQSGAEQSGGEQSAQTGGQNPNTANDQGSPSSSDGQSGSTSTGQGPDSPSSQPAGSPDSGGSQSSSSSGSTPGQSSSEQGGQTGSNGQPQAGGEQSGAQQSGGEQSAQSSSGDGSTPGQPSSEQGSQSSTGGSGQSQQPGAQTGAGQQSAQSGGESQAGGGQSGGGTSSGAGEQAPSGSAGTGEQPGGSSSSAGAGDGTNGRSSQGAGGTTSPLGGGGAQANGPGSDVLPPAQSPNDAPTEQPQMTTSKMSSPVGRVERLVSELERALRRGDLDEKLLGELKWNPENAARFVEEYRQAAKGGQRQVEQTALPQSKIGSLEAGSTPRLLRSDGASTGRPLDAAHTREQDSVRELMEPGRQRVTPRYRPLLEAYYRSVGSRPAPR